MPNPTFNSFALNDNNFITERVTFRGYASREIIRGKINRREGVKLLATEYGEKEVTIEGRVIASSASQLQSLLDGMKTSLTEEEGDLVVEDNRTFKATVSELAIPDEHYNLSTALFQVNFVCSNPFAEGTQLTATTAVPSGVFTFSGFINISGSMFNRPTIVYTPPNTTGKTFVSQLVYSHTPTGQTTTISGFGSGTSLNYQDSVTLNYDTFTSLEGTSAIGNTGAFPRWEPGENNYTITASGRAFPGGTVQVTYKPRWL